MKLIGYIRVSTEFQTESRHGLDAQIFAIQKYAENCKIPIAYICRDEGFSGGLPVHKRPGILEAINLLNKDDILVVTKRDRLGRDVLIMAMIESAVIKKGAKIVSLAGEGTENDDPTGMLMRRMIDAFSEYERLIIGCRVSAALQSKKRKKERIGHIPYGFKLHDDGIHLEENSDEQNNLDIMFKLRKNGISIRNIALKMNLTKKLNRNNQPWNHMSVKRVVIERIKKI